MIVLLSCSTNLLISSFAANSSTGGLKQDSLANDSVLIAYSDLRKVNAKLIELEYEKEINRNLKTIIYNDSIAIDGLKLRIYNNERDYRRRVENVKRERNIAGGIGIGAIILLIISGLCFGIAAQLRIYPIIFWPTLILATNSFNKLYILLSISFLRSFSSQHTKSLYC